MGLLYPKKKKEDCKCECGGQENYIASIYIFRNMVNALFGDDPDFRIFEVNQPLPDGTIEKYDDGETCNILCADVNKLVILQDKLGNCIDLGKKLYFDYYYGNPETSSIVNINNTLEGSNNLTEPGTNLDIALLFEGNPHYSRFFSGWTQMGPVWCVVFKPELIQFFTDDGTSLTGRRSCAMEDIAKVVFPKMDHYKIYFSTENIENYDNEVLENTSNQEIEEHNFYNCERIYDVTTPQTALLWWHNVAIFHCHEDGNWYATCDKRFMGFRMEDTVVRCKSEEKARQAAYELDYNARYVEFRNHPQSKGFYDVDQGDNHPRRWGFFGDWGEKKFNATKWRDHFIADDAELK